MDQNKGREAGMTVRSQPGTGTTLRRIWSQNGDIMCGLNFGLYKVSVTQRDSGATVSDIAGGFAEYPRYAIV